MTASDMKNHARRQKACPYQASLVGVGDTDHTVFAPGAYLMNAAVDPQAARVSTRGKVVILDECHNLGPSAVEQASADITHSQWKRVEKVRSCLALNGRDLQGPVVGQTTHSEWLVAWQECVGNKKIMAFVTQMRAVWDQCRPVVVKPTEDGDFMSSVCRLWGSLDPGAAGPAAAALRTLVRICWSRVQLFVAAS